MVAGFLMPQQMHIHLLRFKKIASRFPLAILVFRQTLGGPHKPPLLGWGFEELKIENPKRRLPLFYRWIKIRCLSGCFSQPNATKALGWGTKQNLPILLETSWISGILVEAAGVEPASENVAGQETTCLFAFMPQAFSVAA